MLALLTCGSGISARAADQNGGQEAQKQEERKSVLYQWTDGKGVVHITDDLNKIPGKYRANARRLETSPGTAETPGPSGEAGISPAPDESVEEERQADLKEEWQLRMKRAKQRLEEAERHYHELDQKRNDLLGSWGGPASGHIAGREEAARIEDDMKQVKKEIDAARNEVENVIPEAARKAGVPPGWLRE